MIEKICSNLLNLKFLYAGFRHGEQVKCEVIK